MIDDIGARAKAAARQLATTSSAKKSAALRAMAAAVDLDRARILAANDRDMAAGADEGISDALMDRLLLNDGRIDGIVSGLNKVADLPDPVGVHTGGWKLYNGVRVQRTRVPLGVVAVIYEARPNVTADAGGLCVKAGNAAILRGSSYAYSSNAAIGEVMRQALEREGLNPDAVQIFPDTTRDGARALMQAKGYVDLLVPRGGPGLIAAIEAEATVPFVIDGAGNCHVYVDAEADLEKAAAITFNSKVQRPGVCNAAETLVVHAAVADKFLPGIAIQLMEAGVELRGDEKARNLVGDMKQAVEEDWGTEYHDLIMSVKVVDSLDEAIEHVRTYGTGHTEAIVTEDYSAAQQFVEEIDSAVTMVNASTRFTDGEEFGFGAEIGISTQKLHVRGPMGLEALTTERYILYGDGQIR
ncbi:MAG: glutamate-5-semialdehyde dehydrogenase [Acidimicrobiia bacterium]|nr:glutamate-5-semialdehyde dehydrogenase [Acidimicrobiia bacterium]MBT8248906.1 glutamate-5-semialdehyde dehydrogenase [Acidimicrobiia bacterium]NNL27080.1 glutamate-5-semialdehyde dehydrogenase [Acidimicrobiia bacterium]